MQDLLRGIPFLRNQSVSQSVQRPRNNLIAIDHAVVETYLLKIDFDSSRSDGH